MSTESPLSPPPSSTPDPGGEGLRFGIGALSEATGVPAPTLRTWERRYGFPVAERTAGGQRVYPPATVQHVQLAARAMAAGHRPAAVFHASIEDLRALVGAAPLSGRAGSAARLDVAALDGPALETEFRQAIARDGLWSFVKARVVPLLGEVGDACAEGRLSIYQEHVLSERLREVLVSGWRPLADRNDGPLGLCATLPGERHALGLHLVACALVLEGWRVLFFGVDLPVADVVGGAHASGADAVFVSVSSSGAPVAAAPLLELREGLDAGLPLVIGGSGAPGTPGAVRIQSLDDLRAWLRRFGAG